MPPTSSVAEPRANVAGNTHEVAPQRDPPGAVHRLHAVEILLRRLGCRIVAIILEQGAIVIEGVVVAVVVKGEVSPFAQVPSADRRKMVQSRMRPRTDTIP